MINVKREPNDDDVLMLLNLDDDICSIIDSFDTSYILYNSKSSNPIFVFLDVNKISYNLLYMKFVCHSSSSQCLPLHPFFMSFNIVDALKIIMCRMFKSDLTYN